MIKRLLRWPNKFANRFCPATKSDGTKNYCNRVLYHFLRLCTTYLASGLCLVVCAAILALIIALCYGFYLVIDFLSNADDIVMSIIIVVFLISVAIPVLIIDLFDDNDK